MTSSKNAKTAAYYAAFVSLGVAGAVIGPTLPGLVENTQSRLSEISILFPTLSLGYLVGSFQAGRLYDRFRGHWLIGAMLVVMALLLAILPVTTVLWPLVLVAFLLGSAEGILDVGGNTLLVWVHRDRVGPYMNGLHFAFGVGASLAPFVVAQVLEVSDGISWAYWSLSLLILPVALWVFRLSSPAIRRVDGPRNVSALRTGRVLIALIAGFFFLYVGAEKGYGDWVSTYAVTLELMDEAQAAYLVSAFWGALTVGRLLSVPFAARLRPRSILIGALVGCLASLGIVLGWKGESWALWVGSTGLGFSMAPIFPTTLALAERRIQITGKVTSWFFVGASIGGMGLPGALGPLIEFIGPRSMMWALLVDLLLAVIVFSVLIRRADGIEEGVSNAEMP